MQILTMNQKVLLLPKPGLEPTVSASSALLLSAGPAAEQATGSSTSHSPSFTPHLMCKRNPSPPAEMPVRSDVSIGENQGTHFEVYIRSV